MPFVWITRVVSTPLQFWKCRNLGVLDPTLWQGNVESALCRAGILTQAFQPTNKNSRAKHARLVTDCLPHRVSHESVDGCMDEVDQSRSEMLKKEIRQYFSNKNHLSSHTLPEVCFTQLYSLANPVSDDPDVRLKRLAPKQVLKIGSYGILLCTRTRTQSLPSAKIFLLEEGLFFLGHFRLEEKAKSRVRKDRCALGV